MPPIGRPRGAPLDKRQTELFATAKAPLGEHGFAAWLTTWFTLEFSFWAWGFAISILMVSILLIGFAVTLTDKAQSKERCTCREAQALQALENNVEVRMDMSQLGTHLQMMQRECLQRRFRPANAPAQV